MVPFTVLLRHFTGSNEFLQAILFQNKHDHLPLKHEEDRDCCMGGSCYFSHAVLPPILFWPNKVSKKKSLT